MSKWSELINELNFHCKEFQLGNDYDNVNEKTLHIDKIAEIANTLSKYYRINPQGDDRNHKYLSVPKIGLDIDEVLADWLPAWMKKFKIKNVPTTWFFDHKIRERFDELRANNELDNFFLNLQPRVKPTDIPFEPHCYITSRPVDSEISRQWLEKHGFPLRPVYTVGTNQSKLEVALQSGVEWFVDDGYHNFIELNKGGVCCFLWDTPHNKKFDVGFKRIKSFNELVY
jgi:hypothetical protein